MTTTFGSELSKGQKTVFAIVYGAFAIKAAVLGTAATVAAFEGVGLLFTRIVLREETFFTAQQAVMSLFLGQAALVLAVFGGWMSWKYFRARGE